MKKSLFALLFVLLSAALADAATKYVDADCTNAITTYDPVNNACTGGTSTVYNTVRNGIKALTCSDVLHIRSGTYVESGYGTSAGDVWASGCGGSYATATTVAGYPGDARPILRFTGNNVLNIGTSITGPTSYIIVEGLEIDAVNVNVGAIGIYIGQTGYATHHIKLSNLIVRDAKFANISSSGGASNIWLTNSTLINGGGAVREGDQEHGFYCRGVNNLYEYNEIYGSSAYGFHCRETISGNNNGTVIRYNKVHDNADVTTSAAGIIISGCNSGCEVYGNLVYRVTSQAVCIQAGGTGAASTGIKVYNNTCNGHTGLGIQIAGDCTSCIVKNNISKNNGGADLSDSGVSTSKGSNLCDDVVTGCINGTVGYVNVGAQDFRLLPTSAAIDAGEAGSTCLATNGASGCTIGAYDPPRFASCSAAANILTVNYTNNRFPPISNLDTTGKTATIDASGRTLSAPTLVGTNQVIYTFSGAALSATATFADDGSGTLSDSAKIGPTVGGQKVKSFTAQTCSTSAPTGTWELRAFRFHGLRGTGASPQVLPHAAAVNNTNITIIKGGSVRLRMAIIRNTADTLNISPKLYCELTPIATGIPGGYFTVPDAFDANNIKFRGTDTDPDIPTSGTLTTNLLGAVGAGSFVPGALMRTADAVPAVSIAPTNWTEMEWILDIDSDATAGDTYDCRPRDQDGTIFSTHTVTPRMTVINEQAGGGL
jgi:hypothetical protein